MFADRLFQDFQPDDDPVPNVPPEESSPRTYTLQQTSTRITTANGIHVSVDRERESVGRGHESSAPLIKGAPPQEIINQRKSSGPFQCVSDCSPATKTIERLRSFKFVKTATSKLNSSHPKRPPTCDNQSGLTPPPSKRRSIHNDVTLNRDSAVDPGDRRHSTSNDDSTFKQPSFNPRMSSTHLPYLSQSRGQSSNVSAKVVPTEHLHDKVGASVGAHSNFSTTQSNVCHQPNHSDPIASLPSTPTLSSSVPHSDARAHSGALSTPRSKCTCSCSQSTTITTPRQRSMADPMMQTPTRVRQTTPLVCTPTGSGTAPPIARASVPLKRKFPGPAGLLPSLVCSYSCGRRNH